jgi:hypothetical protein
MNFDFHPLRLFLVFYIYAFYKLPQLILASTTARFLYYINKAFLNVENISINYA